MVQKGCWAQTPALWHTSEWELFPDGNVTIYTLVTTFISDPVHEEGTAPILMLWASKQGVKDSRVNTVCCHRPVTNWRTADSCRVLTSFHKLTAFRKGSFSLKDTFFLFLTLGSINFELSTILPTAELKNHCFYFCLRFVAADSLFIRYFLKFQSQEGIIIYGLLKAYIPITT